MYAAAGRRPYEDQIPPFMTVFDLDQAMQDQDTVTVVDPRMMEMDPTCKSQLPADPSQLIQPPAIPPNHQHQLHDSTSTHNSESADSSPTTTTSCTDSSSLSDPSPSSSPDSPTNLVPLNAFPATHFGGLPSMASLTVSEHANQLVRPMTSPTPRRPRNTKGLFIQPPAATSSSMVSEPSSPSFIKPKIPAMRRKPSQLSLKTNSDDLVSRPAIEVPQSPLIPALAKRRALKHSTSSPHMLAELKSSTFGPVDGMTFPTVFERNESGLSSFLRPAKPPTSTSYEKDDAIMEEDSPIKSQMANRFAFDTEPFHEKEGNEDQKSPAYPNGPIAIYENNVYLYLEPTAEEASKFDVVINVAREVPNPFKDPSAQDQPMLDMSPVPGTAVTDASFATALEYLPDDETPTTPKALSSSKEPEYIHIPWDHNTDIGSDLMYLCETIKRKALAGQKVLVHCQQGASRSASLIIAYGLYQNPEMSVNDAYYAAQSKSKWISPNMRLMYCLQDFQKEVRNRRLSPKSAYKPRSGRCPSKHRMTLSVDGIEVPKESRAAPMPDEDASNKKSANPFKSALRARGNSTPNPDQITVAPGPYSAPSTFSRSEKEDEEDGANLGNNGPFHAPDISHTTSPIDGIPHSSVMSAVSLSAASPKPPPLPGLGPCFSNAVVKPLPSPAFGSFSDAPKPPLSPGFGTHRFGGNRGLGLTPLSLRSHASPKGHAPEIRTVHLVKSLHEDSALMSPRAEIITNNPVHTSFAECTGMRFVEVPPTPNEQLFSPRDIPDAKLFSPREATFPRDAFSPFVRPQQITDPRSPPTKGEAPIVRSIDQVI